MARTDIFGITPKIGDTIVFNPPNYKGLSISTCVGLTDGGSPKVNNIIRKSTYSVDIEIKYKGFYIVKTDFLVR